MRREELISAFAAFPRQTRPSTSSEFDPTIRESSKQVCFAARSTATELTLLRIVWKKEQAWEALRDPFLWCLFFIIVCK